MATIQFFNTQPQLVKLALVKDFTLPFTADDEYVQVISFTTKQAKSSILHRRHAIHVYGADASGVNQKTVSGATNASPIVITTSAAHGYATGDRIIVSGVGGNTAADGSWLITNLTSTTFSLDGSTGNGAYTSGGITTNRSSFDGINLYINPTVTRGNLSEIGADDDVNGILITNSGTAKATDAIYIAASGGIVGSAWDTVFAAQADATNGIQMLGTYTKAIDITSGTTNLADQIIVTHGTITSSKPVLSHTVTWNSGGTTFTNILSNVTNTASDANSMLIDLQVGGTSQFKVIRDGGIINLGNNVLLGSMFLGNGLTMPEISDAAAPSANRGVLYVRDNGASKSQLVVRFPTGAVQVIATEP